MAAVSAEPGSAGQLLWKTTDWNRKIVAPCPLQIDNQRIIMTSGHGAGSMMFEVSSQGDVFSIASLGAIDKTLFASEQQTPILHDGGIFTVLPKDAGMGREQLICFSPKGDVLWSSGKGERFGLGPYLVADGKLFILDDSGVLTMLKASTAKFALLGRAKILQGRDAWGPLALADGFLICRDSKRMVCLDVRR